jgi:hypothetical protein
MLARIRAAWNHPATFYASFSAFAVLAFLAGGWEWAVPPVGYMIVWTLLWRLA